MPQPPSSVVAAGAVVGGLRLVRKLGDARAAQVFLGFGAGGEEPVTAAVKVYAEHQRDRAEVEIQALSRVTGAHVVRLSDLANAPGGGAALILERLELGSLAQLLENRAALTPGEAVTILAPLARAVDELHAAGVSHGSLSPLRVLFRADGAPVLIGFGAAGLHESAQTPARLAELQTVHADRVALAALARLVLERAGGASSAGVLTWIAQLELEGFPDPIGHELADRLFDSAEAQPVRFDRSEPLGSHAVPARVAARVAASDAAVSQEHEPPRSRPAWLVGFQLPDWLEDAARESVDESPLSRLRASLLPRLRAALSGVRRPVWIVAGTVACALVAALILVPQETSRPVVARSDPQPAATETPIADETPGPIDGDDPVAALLALLERRDRCVRELSVLCLDEVLQAGSAALARDAALIGEVQSGGELGPDAVIAVQQAALVERLGDSALVSLGDVPKTQPASTLLMKGEAGWRIRGYLD